MPDGTVKMCSSGTWGTAIGKVFKVGGSTIFIMESGDQFHITSVTPDRMVVKYSDQVYTYHAGQVPENCNEYFK